MHKFIFSYLIATHCIDYLIVATTSYCNDSNVIAVIFYFYFLVVIMWLLSEIVHNIFLQFA